MEVVAIVTLSITIFTLFKELIYKEFIYPEYKKRKAQKNIEKKVSWICAPTLLGRDRALIKYIDEWQHEITIDDKYRVKTNEHEFPDEHNAVQDILISFQQLIAQDFFADNLKKDEQFLQLNEKEYFLISLLQFLNRNIDNCSLLSKKIHRLHSPEFSEFGKVYLKLCYIVNLICENYDKLSICSIYDSFGKFDKFIQGNSINVKKHIDLLNEEK